MMGPLTLIVIPKKRKPGFYIARLYGCGLSIRETRYPLLDCARGLLLCGCDPKTVLIMRHSGSTHDRVKGQIGAIVRKLSRKGRLSAIKRFPDSETEASSPREASTVNKIPKPRVE